MEDSKFYNSLVKLNPIHLIGIWILFMFIQAVSTPIHIDEAYYWMYSKKLAWGYFDHPPAVALFIYLSSILFKGNLGVRLFTIVAQVVTGYLIYRTINFKSNFTERTTYSHNALILVFFLLPLNHIFGFITTPDVPLLLSTSAFFLVYKKLLNDNTWANNILWGIVMSLMLYSKYHAALVIIFVLISNPKLFLNIKTYIAGAIGLALFIPHFIWQYDHGFASFMYHLSERVVIQKWSYPLEYILNAFLVFNPLLIGLLYKVFKSKWSNDFQRGLYFTLAGFLLFFLWQSIRVNVQPQWLILCYIPFVILLFENWNDKYLKMLKIAFFITLPLVILLRIFLIVDILPLDFNIHGNKEYTEQIKQDAKGKPVIFYDSYKRASIYSWYQNIDYTHSYNSSRGRKNQFNLWEKDSIFFNEYVYFVGTWSAGSEPVYYENENFYGNTVQYFPSDKIQIEVENFQILEDSIFAEINISNPYSIRLTYPDTFRLGVRYLKDNRIINEMFIFDDFNYQISSNSNSNFEIKWPKPKNSEVNSFAFTTCHYALPFGPLYYRYKFNQ